ncbi:TPA: DUF535 family protein, partial [Citrobacter freundii]|nr:DUF535 family protein [Citrobacter freundii]
NWYKLPIYVERKSFNELASKKRAEYRRRYDLLDHINEEIMILLQNQM